MVTSIRSTPFLFAALTGLSACAPSHQEGTLRIAYPRGETQTSDANKSIFPLTDITKEDITMAASRLKTPCRWEGGYVQRETCSPEDAEQLTSEALYQAGIRRTQEYITDPSVSSLLLIAVMGVMLAEPECQVDGVVFPSTRGVESFLLSGLKDHPERKEELEKLGRQVLDEAILRSTGEATRFIDSGLQCHNNNPDTGCAFASLLSDTMETVLVWNHAVTSSCPYKSEDLSDPPSIMHAAWQLLYFGVLRGVKWTD